MSEYFLNQFELMRTLINDISDRLDKEHGDRAREVQAQIWKVRDEVKRLESKINALI
jgi:hypothetical protein